MRTLTVTNDIYDEEGNVLWPRGLALTLEGTTWRGINPLSGNRVEMTAEQLENNEIACYFEEDDAQAR